MVLPAGIGQGTLCDVSTTEPIAELFDRECCLAAETDRAPTAGVDDVSALLLDVLREAGFSGGTVLELGSGDGTLSRELLTRGADSVTGVDLSARSVEYATARAHAAGFGGRLSYEVGDAAKVSLPPCEAVVSEKVFCCYPDVGLLLANTLPAARSVYALVLPESRGPLGWLSRFLITLENSWRWLRREQFRAHVHDVRSIERMIAAAGFVRRASRRHGMWRALAFSRA
ncbi:MAG: methyltransferase domain-containing protein [Chloroflexota bacterium]|nr:methyltransferase domain-containing protein [Chloroflexota bacterium]